MQSEILKNLPRGFPWGSNLRYYDTIGSTNTQAKMLIQEGAPEGTILVADCQTGGRGRLGRSFQSPGGMGVYMSVILRPDCWPRDLMHLTCASAVAMCDAVEAVAGFRPGIKWTNDLVWSRRKLCGILTELVLDPKTGKISGAVIGVGINCCQTPADFPPELQHMAGSLEMAAGKRISRAALAAAMIQAFYHMNRNLFEKEEIIGRYQADCITVGREISLVRGSEIRHGKALGIDENGALLVEFSPGKTEAVSSGEISIRGMYGYV